MPAETGQRHGAVVGWGAHTPLVSNRVQDVVTTGTIALDRDVPAASVPGSVQDGVGATSSSTSSGTSSDSTTSKPTGRSWPPRSTTERGRWGQGDLAGLAYLGREAGCLEVPRPRDVDMAPEPRIR
jgi:hypothetical protein